MAAVEQIVFHRSKVRKGSHRRTLLRSIVYLIAMIRHNQWDKTHLALERFSNSCALADTV
jgi:hypothetical protein